MEDCIFCKIISGKIPSAKIYEDKSVVSFLDIMPANKGHCLIVPKKHYKNLIEIADSDLSEFITACKKISKALSFAFGNIAFNLLMNNGRDAGQLVEHAHIHLIPRFQNDSIVLKWNHKKYDKSEIDSYKEKIKKFLT